MLRKAEKEKRDILESLNNTSYVIDFASESVVDTQLSHDATHGLYFVLVGVRDSLKKILEDIESINVAEETQSVTAISTPLQMKNYSR